MLHTSVRYHWHWMVNLCSAPWTVHVQQCPFLAETAEPILPATAEPDIEGNCELGRQIRTSCSPYMGNLLKPAGWGCPSESPVASALNTNTTAHSRWGFSFWLHCRRHQIPSTPHVEKDASATVLPKGRFLKDPFLGWLSAKLKSCVSVRAQNTDHNLATREDGRVNSSGTLSRGHCPNRERLSEHRKWSSVGLIDA